MGCWIAWNKSHCKVHKELRHRKPGEMKQTPVEGAGKFCPRKLSAWRRCTRQLSLASFSLLDHQTLRICPAIFTVGCAGRTSLYSHMGIMKCCGISKAVVTLPVIRACVCKTSGWHVLDFHGNPLGEDEPERQRGEDQEGTSCGAWPWASVCGGLDHQWSWCCWPAIAGSDKSVLLGGCAEDERHLWSRLEAVGAVCANRRACQHWGSLDSLGSFVRFRKFPESLRLTPILHCCLAFSHSS